MGLKEDLRSGLSCNKNGYFNSFQNNVYGGEMPERFQEMFDNGSGGELHSKAEAVHSSSMLAYNFFHWIDEQHPFRLEEEDYTEVLFEVKLKTLKQSNFPANMDVVLKGKDCLLFIESKFLEYTESVKFDLSKSYNNPKKWYSIDINWDNIIQPVRNLVANNEEKVKNKYGVKQLITHLFGITSLKNEDALKWFNKNNVFKIEKDDLPRIKFISLVFEPDADNYKEEHDQYENYYDLEKEFLKILGKNLNDYLPVHKTYSELWKVMESQIKDSQLKEFLKQRYMRFAKKV